MSRKTKITVSLFSLILWMALIYWFSSRTAESSSAQSDSLKSTLEWIFTNIFYIRSDSALFGLSTFIIRKSAHLFLFFVLGILSFNVCFQKKLAHVFFTAALFSLIYAVSDEFHQYFVPGRSAEIKDIIIDFAGSLIGIIIINYFLKKRR